MYAKTLNIYENTINTWMIIRPIYLKVQINPHGTNYLHCILFLSRPLLYKSTYIHTQQKKIVKRPDE